MDEKKESPDSATQDFNEKSGTPTERVAQLSEKLKEQIFGHSEAVAELTKKLAGKPARIPLLYGSPGISKKEWARQMAEMAQKAQNNPNPSGVIFIDEPMSMNPDQLMDALDVAFGRATRGQLGDEAAQACRDGVAVTPMKQLTLKRGFAYLG